MKAKSQAKAPPHPPLYSAFFFTGENLSKRNSKSKYLKNEGDFGRFQLPEIKI